MCQKKMIAALLISVMTLGLLTGCGTDKEQKDNSAVLEDSQIAGDDSGTLVEGTQGSENNSLPTGTTENTEAAESTDGTENADSAESVTPQYPEIISDGKITEYGSVVVVKDAAYELYTYLDKDADNYAKSINTVAKNLEGKAEVYGIVIPLGSGIVFPDNLREQISSTNQREAITKIQDKMDKLVKNVDIYDSLMEHRDEYIYFRTDHHWTARGAYYAYEDFCAVKGIEPEALDSYETKSFDGFLGSFYNDTGKAEVLGNNPDLVTAYCPNMDAVCHVTDANGVEYDSPVIYNESNAAAGLKYSTFIAGDNPYTVIENKELTDGTSCVVVKESFGNAFVPFLVDHYQTIYVVDYRYWTGSVSELAAEKGVSDVIFLNNLSMIRNKNLVGKLYRVI